MRILILMSDTGGGHRSAALAIREALAGQVPGVVVDIVDFLANSGLPLKPLVPGYGKVIRYPWAWRLIYRASDRPAFMSALAGAPGAVLRRAIRLAVRDSQADVVVSVHPLAATGLTRTLDRLGMGAPVVVVVTDLVSFHPTWAAPRASAVSVPTPLARDALVSYGVPAGRISVLGLPVDASFTKDLGDRGELRKRLGLDPERFTLLLVGGGEGTGGLEKLCAAAAAHVRGGQVVVVTGRNEVLRKRMSASRWPVPVQVLGFSRNMAELMRAADVLVTKAGPGTISEALACGLPIVITSALPGQEEANVSYVVDHGAGVTASTPEQLGEAIDRLTGDGGAEAVEAMAAAARRLAKPRAADDIASLILTVAQQAGVAR